MYSNCKVQAKTKVRFPILLKWLDGIFGDGDGAGAGKPLLTDEGYGDWNGDIKGPINLI